MATHSSILAWRTPWTEDPGGLWYMGSHRIRHDRVTEDTHTCVCVCLSGSAPLGNLDQYMDDGIPSSRVLGFRS